ncbi:group II intron reverse transcriptase/maturase [Burkholderia pseudomallei]|uniref:group II intron reverse transcriptase/maturase n=1 Tax=Burkholderia pseudomallei TaxID=28450 RepID=UPI000F06B104|nr:group II intron reverse transcriptase/maturase [Burkholderia pseudomallei]VBI28628.1 RNA-directed DNA polymerase [Burkholderia pseudomallei]
MTTLQARVGAPSHEAVAWHQIDWAKCHREVRRLQTRIAKATREGRWSKVKALQWLLTHSFAGKVLAVKRVTENQGKNTPGVDGVTWSSPAVKSQAVLSLKRRGYQPLPLRRVYIPKRNHQLRPLGIPAMTDRAQQALHLLALEPIAETTADPNSYGFRPGRSTADAIEQCFKALALKTAAEWILEGDIKGCYDNISHDWLSENIPMDRAVLQKWLKAGYVEGRTLFATEAGTPQGGIISPVLANMTLDGLERLLHERFPVQRLHKVNFVRYADDFVITGDSREFLENEVKPLVEAFLKARGLTLSPEKTRITHIDDGFDFLGQHVRKYNGKLLIKPSPKNVKAFLDKVRRIVKDNKSAKQISLIRLLNPVIKGWANYHRHVVSSKVFHAVNHEIWHILWQWAKRRHPKKGKRWIRDKYFPTVAGRKVVFAVPVKGELLDGRQKVVKLFNASDTPIRRHVKIKAAANPFDPSWEAYFEKRLSLKMANNLMGRRKLLSLWYNQNGDCVVCQEKLTQASGWHVHHIVYRCHGGGDNISNLVMVHPNCHRQIHSQKLSVVKPVHEHGL